MSKTKRAIKKVTKKIEAKKTPEQIEYEKFEKKQEAFSKRMTTFSGELDKLAKTHKVKILVQGYDIKDSATFITGGNINNLLEREAMETYTKNSFTS